MRRDFSEQARRELLSLVRQVEDENLCDFTDWVGDRWLDFQSWIGALDIRRYLNNVNDYHKKVIDQNNASEQSINAIFQRVGQVDSGYRTLFDGVCDDLDNWKAGIDRLAEYIQPANGQFDTVMTPAGLMMFRWQLEKENQTLIRDQLYQIKDGQIEINEAVLEAYLARDPASMTNADIYALRELAGLLAQEVGVEGQPIISAEEASKLLEIISGTIEVGNTYTADHEGVGLAGEILGYLSALIAVHDTKGKPATDVASNLLSLIEKTAGVWIGMEELLAEKLLPAAEGLKLHERFGNVVVGANVVKYISAFIRGGIDSYKVFTDANSSGYDKTAAGMELGGDALVMGGSIVAAGLYNQKTIQWVAADGKIRNQILAVDAKVDVSNAVSSKITKVMSWVAVGDVILNTGAGGLRRVEEVNADGEMDMGDWASVGIHGSMSGIETVANHLSLGLVEIDGEGFADELEESVDEFVQSDHWAAEVVRNQDNNIFLRGTVAFGAGACILVQETGEAVGEKIESTGNWIKSKWDDFTDFFW